MQSFTIWYLGGGDQWEYTAHREARDEDEALDRFFASCEAHYRRPGEYRVTSSGVRRTVTLAPPATRDRVVAGMLIQAPA